MEGKKKEGIKEGRKKEEAQRWTYNLKTQAVTAFYGFRINLFSMFSYKTYFKNHKFTKNKNL